MKRLILCIIIAGAFYSPAFSNAESDHVFQVAHSGYRAFISKCLDRQALKQWGLSDADNLTGAELGSPFRVMQIKPDFITGFKRNATINAILEFSNTYFFPITFAGKIKLIMTVHKYPGRDTWEIGSIGHVHLAQEIKKILTTWPRNRGYTPTLCVNYQTQSYAFSIPQVSDNNLTLIDRTNTDRMYRNLSSLSASMLLLKTRLLECALRGGK